MTIAILLVVAYLLGSLPFGLWLARSEGVDLRSTGSGNIGATNVLRTTGRLLAAVVLMLDSGKGIVAVLLARLLSGEPDVIVGCAIAVVAGHMWPIWAGFRGGKGVATTAGAWSMVVWVAVVWSIVVFGSVVAMTRYVSVASVAAALVLPVMTYLLDGSVPATTGAMALAALVVLRHHGNLARLASGTEPRVGTPGVKARRRGPFVQ
jgi:acyl phosphate:glycerol-3-phosphate acyltransferase